jgi:uncharacterized RDD family membrane protein YckC
VAQPRFFAALRSRKESQFPTCNSAYSGVSSIELSRRPTILTCEHCGTEIPDGASFCARCGSPVSVAQIGPVYVPSASPPAEEIPGPQRVAPPQAPPRYAGFWLRAVASLIDRVILSFLFVLMASFRPALFLILPDPSTQLRPPATLQEFLLSVPRPTPAGFLVLLLLMWIYYAGFEASSWQATPGKKVLRLYVADLLGRPITFARATFHNIGRTISEMTFWVGYVPIGFTDKKQALHDIIARCVVLRRP